MNDLERIFKENRELFNQEEPQDRHLERFIQRINKQQRIVTVWENSIFLKVAVIAIFVVLSGAVGYQIRNLQGNQYGLGTISPEYQEVELYYTSHINSQINLINTLTEVNSGEQEEIVNAELKHMDNLYKELKKELKANPKDERIIQAMIEHYQVKLNILNKIIEQLHQVKRQKTYQYETTQI